MHADLRTSAAATCICWLAAFLLGSIPIGHLVERSQLRRDLRRLERRNRRPGAPDLHAFLGGVRDNDLPGMAELVGAALDTAKVLGLTIAALVIVRAASPGIHRGQVPASSQFGVLAIEALTFWQSAALWAGLAAGVGHLWSMWLGFRSSGQAQAPLLALALRFTPTGFVVAVAAYLLGRVLVGPRRAVIVSLTGFVAWVWVSWLRDLPHWWGYPYGQEVAIWAVVMAGVVAAKNFAGGGLSPRS
jgi:glycerol-3-phosphate acyltransferase PlsY